MRKMNRGYIFSCMGLCLFCLFICLTQAVQTEAAEGPHVGENAYSYVSYGKGEDWAYLWSVTNASAVSTVKGITYDLETNTITINNVSGDSMLVANEMGDDLKLVVNGNNTFSAILVYGFGYGGSLTISGSGSITITDDSEKQGLSLLSEESASKLIIKKGVTLTSENGISVSYNTIKDAIILEEGVTIKEGGNIKSLEDSYLPTTPMMTTDGFEQWVSEFKKDGKTYYGYRTSEFLINENGNSSYDGISYVMYELVDGKLSPLPEVSEKEIKKYSFNSKSIYDTCITTADKLTAESFLTSKNHKVVISSGADDSNSEMAKKPVTPTVSVSAKSKAAKITVKSTEDVDGYYIYMAKSKAGKYTKIKGKAVTNTKYSYTKKKLTSGTTYYFKVRSYKLVDGSKVWSSYSSVKSVKVK